MSLFSDDFEEQQTRLQLQAIAHDYAGCLNPEGRQTALKWLTLAFERWKLQLAIEQGRADGCIAIEPPFGGLLDTKGNRTTTLAKIASKSRQIVPLNEVRPEDCAGPSVRCAYDLLGYLHSQAYPTVMECAAKMGIDVLGALLLQRDALTMPLSSLSFGVHMLAIFTRGRADAYREILSEKQRAVADRAAGARAAKAMKRALNSNRSERRSMAAKKWRANFSLTRKEVATAIQKELEKREPPLHHLPDTATIENDIKGVKDIVRQELRRAANR